MNQNNALKFGLIIAALALLTACAGPSQTTLPDGSVAYYIDCDGTAGGMNYCFERAGKSCGAAGYTIVDPGGRTLSKGDVADSDLQALIKVYRTDQNSILVRCGT